MNEDAKTGEPLRAPARAIVDPIADATIAFVADHIPPGGILVLLIETDDGWTLRTNVVPEQQARFFQRLALDYTIGRARGSVVDGGAVPDMGTKQ